MSALYQSRTLADAAAEKLRVYAQPQRLMILSCLVQGEKTVGEIDGATGIGQPALSQQLAALRQAEMVKTRKVAKQVYYDLADEKIYLCVRSMEAILGDGRDPAAALSTVLNSAKPVLKPIMAPAGTAAFARIG
ncbi:MAG: metalloregulator ArsR/SmtB family transcription factor [Chakrabartia sp.]